MTVFYWFGYKDKENVLGAKDAGISLTAIQWSVILEAKHVTKCRSSKLILLYSNTSVISIVMPSSV